MKNNRDMVISFRCYSGDILLLKNMAREKSYTSKKDIKYTDLIREAIREKIHNEK